MNYQTIVTIKESEKATVKLAAVDMFVGPVVVKHLKGSKPEIYRVLFCQNNPHIPKIYAVEEHENELLVAEEYIDGESLREHLQKKLLSDEQKLNYALQLCEAVGFLHALNPSVIHRDIKPSNILINGKGELKLIDFDASRQYKEAPSSSDTRLLGTVEYAPPEQFGYSQTDVRSDIYSMGVVFHEMRPTENKKLEEQWEKIAEKCTSFDPKNRYQSVAELKRELEKLVDWKKNRKVRRIAWIGSIAVLLAVAALVVMLSSRADVAEHVDGAKLTGTPTNEPTEAPTPTPQLRVVDEEALKNVLAELKQTSAYIDTFYKNLNKARDFMQYDFRYEGEQMIFSSVTLYNLVTNEMVIVPGTEFYNENNVLHIRNAFLQGLQASCYRMDISYEDKATGWSDSLTTHLLIKDGAEVSQDAYLIDNNYLEFYYEYVSCVHTILSNDIEGRIMDTDYFTVLEDGRVLQLDIEWLMEYIEPGTEGKLQLIVTLEDGRYQKIELHYKTGKPPYAK